MIRIRYVPPPWRARSDAPLEPSEIMNTFRAIVASIALAAVTTSVRAQTYIEGGKTFLLGGEQTKALLVEGRNTGGVAVEVLAERDGKTRVLQVVKPGSALRQAFAPGELAKFRNTSKSQRATVQFKMTKDIGKLSMRYSE